MKRYCEVRTELECSHCGTSSEVDLVVNDGIGSWFCPRCEDENYVNDPDEYFNGPES